MRPIFRNILMSVSVVVAGATISLAPNPVYAAGPGSDEIWFGDGPDSLEIDDEGKLTDAGAKTRISELDQIPGEEDWEVKIHARMGKFAAEGPLYIEFYQEIQGEEHIVFRHEDADYDGSRLYTTVITLEGNIGFNKNRDYRVQIVQNNGTKDIVMARGKLKLIDTGREAEGGEEEGEDGEEAEDEDGEDEDEDEDDEDEDEEEDDEDDEAADSGTPPPIDETPKTKKGCSVASGGALDLGFTGLAILLLAGAARRRREG